MYTILVNCIIEIEKPLFLRNNSNVMIDFTNFPQKYYIYEYLDIDHQSRHLTL